MTARLRSPFFSDRLWLIFVRPCKQIGSGTNKVAYKFSSVQKQGNGLCRKVFADRNPIFTLDSCAVFLNQDLGRALAQVLLIKPLSLFKIESSSGAVHFVNGEGLHKLIEGKNLLIRSRIPAQKGQHINKTRRIKATFAVATCCFVGFFVDPIQRKDGEPQTVAVALGELAIAVRAQKQGQVGKFRLFPAKKAVQQNVQWRRRKPLFSANYMAYVHQMVVYHIGKVVGRHAVTL